MCFCVLTSSEKYSCYSTDKICDQISDAVLDAHLREDPDAKVACGKSLDHRGCRVLNIHVQDACSRTEVRPNHVTCVF